MRRVQLSLVTSLLLLAWLVGGGNDTLSADEIRPGYLEILEQPAIATDTVHYSIIWKVPFKGGLKLRIDPQFPPDCVTASPQRAQEAPGALIRRWTIACSGGLTGKTIAIIGLEATITDVLVRVETVRGTTQMARLGPFEPSFVVVRESSLAEVSALYTWLGFEHILIGIDHLLFVLALLIIVNNTRKLLWAVTAFTISHSITLAGATLGWLSVPQQPVEAVIALSILFLATEILHASRGRMGLAARYPWVVAFVFGLLHGFGFAGALAEVGLPQHAIPVALLFFNIGVELGQIAFIAAVLAIAWLAKALVRTRFPGIQRAMAFGIGSLAAFWTIERVASFWPQ